MKKLLIVLGALAGIAAIAYVGIIIYTVLFDESGTA